MPTDQNGRAGPIGDGPPAVAVPHTLPPSAESWDPRYHRRDRFMNVNGGAIARNLASVVALGR